MTTKKVRGRGRPPVDSERVDVRLDRPLLTALDTFATEEGCKSRPDAVRLVLKEYFQHTGKLPVDSK